MYPIRPVLAIRNITFKLFILLVALVTSTGMAAPGTAKDKPTLLVTVNGDSILTTDFESQFGSLHSTMSTQDKESFDSRKLLNKMVNDRLLVHEAEAIGMGDEPSIIKLMAKRTKEYAVAGFIKATFTPKDSVTTAEIRDYFLANFSKLQLRTVSVETKQLAADLLAKVRRGADMDSIAKVVSLDIYRYHGGLNPIRFAIDIDPDIKKPALSAKTNELVGPFPLKKVYAFLRLEKSQPPDTADLSKVSDRIASGLKNEKRNEAWRAFLIKLRKEFPVVIDSSLLAAIIHTDNVALDSNFMKGSTKAVAVVASRDTITDSDLRQKIAHKRMAANVSILDSLARQTLDESVNELVLFLVAQKAGFDIQAKVMSRLATTRDSVLIEFYLKETVVSQIKFNHQEFSDYYQTHLDDFREPDDYNLKQIMVGRKELADSVVALVNDGADFNFVASKLLEGKADVDETNKWTSLEVFPQAIQADLIKIPTGGITKPYQTADGWIIFKIKERRAGKIKTQADSEIQIRDIMFQKKFDQQLDQVLGALKKNARIVYHNDAIDGYLGKEKSR